MLTIPRRATRRFSALLLALLGWASGATAAIPLADLTTAKVREHMGGFMATDEAKSIAKESAVPVKADGLSWDGAATRLTWEYSSRSALDQAQASTVESSMVKLIEQGFGNYKQGLLATDDLNVVKSGFRVEWAEAPKPGPKGPSLKPEGGNKPVAPPAAEGLPPAAALPYAATQTAAVTYAAAVMPYPAMTYAGCVSPPLAPAASGCRLFGLLRRPHGCVPIAPNFGPCGGCGSVAYAVPTYPAAPSCCSSPAFAAAPVRAAGYAVAAADEPLSAKHWGDLQSADRETLLGDATLLVSSGRLAAATRVLDLALALDAYDSLAWSWKAVVERKQGRHADAADAAERAAACLVIKGAPFESLALGLEKVQGDDRAFLRNAPAPATVASAQAVADRPWKKLASAVEVVGK